MPDISTMSSELEILVALAVAYLPKLLLALITLFVGLRLTTWIVRLTKRVLEKQSVDSTLQGFLGSVLGMTLKVLLVISVASMVGVEMTSFIAVLGAAGLAIGMALSGTLQNFAGGVMLLLLKPFKAGDVIEAEGFIGIVAEIQIFHTILKTFDNRTIIIPNSPLASGSIINYSAESTRRIDFSFGVGYNDNLDKVRSVLEGLIRSDSRILEEPAHFIGVGGLGESSVDFTVRVWVESKDYGDVMHEFNEQVKKAFDREGISIPYPQRELRLLQSSVVVQQAANG